MSWKELCGEATRLLEQRRVPLNHSRTAVTRKGQLPRSLLLGGYVVRGIGLTRATGQSHYQQLLPVLHELAQRRRGSPCGYVSINLNQNNLLRLHQDLNNYGDSYLLGLGNYGEGQLWVQRAGGLCNPPKEICVTRDQEALTGVKLNARHRWVRFNPRELHGVCQSTGVRFSITLFSPRLYMKLSVDHFAELLRLGFPCQEFMSENLASVTLGPPKESQKSLVCARGSGEIAAEHVEGSVNTPESEDAQNLAVLPTFAPCPVDKDDVCADVDKAGMAEFASLSADKDDVCADEDQVGIAEKDDVPANDGLVNDDKEDVTAPTLDGVIDEVQDVHGSVHRSLADVTIWRLTNQLLIGLNSAFGRFYASARRLSSAGQTFDRSA
eukprot:3274369-Amphidinium_carterae.1